MHIRSAAIPLMIAIVALTSCTTTTTTTTTTAPTSTTTTTPTSATPTTTHSARRPQITGSAPHTDHRDPNSPAYVTTRGVPKRAIASDGSSADITFESIWWKPEDCDGGWGCAIVELTITGLSPKPFAYNDSYVIVGYGGGPHPWTTPEDSNEIGGSSSLDYQAAHKLPPLRMGTVTQGQTAHGYVGFGLNGLSRGQDLYVKVSDPLDATRTEAGWRAVLH